MIKVFVRSLIPFSVLLYVISLVALGYTSFPRDFISSIFVNSDSVFHTYYVQEIFQAGKDPRTWLLPHSFLIFPEFMLFLVVRLVVGGNVGLVNFITGVLTFAVVQLSVVFLIVNAFDFNKNRVAQVFTLLAFLNTLLTTTPFVLFFYMSLAPHFHLGTILNAVICLLCVKKYLDNKKFGLLLGLANTLFILSDPIFLFYFTLPAIALAVLRRKKIALDQFRPLLIILFASSSLSLFLYILLPTARGYFTKNIIQVFPYELFSVYVRLGWYTDFISIFNPTPLLLAVIVGGGFSYFKLSKKTSGFSDKTFFNVFFTLFILFSFLAYFIFRRGLLLDLRFVFPVFLTLLLLIVIFVSSLINSRIVLTLAMFVVTTILLVRFTVHKSTFRDIGQEDSKLSACIGNLVEEQSWDYGVSGFWLGRKLSVLSNLEINILPVYLDNGRVVGKVPFGDISYAGGHSIDYVVSNKDFGNEWVEEWLGPSDSHWTCEPNTYVFYYANSKINENLQVVW